MKIDPVKIYTSSGLYFEENCHIPHVIYIKRHPNFVSLCCVRWAQDSGRKNQLSNQPSLVKRDSVFCIGLICAAPCEILDLWTDTSFSSEMNSMTATHQKLKNKFKTTNVQVGWRWGGGGVSTPIWSLSKCLYFTRHCVVFIGVAIELVSLNNLQQQL